MRVNQGTFEADSRDDSELLNTGSCSCGTMAKHGDVRRLKDLASLAIILLTITPNSTGCERIFSEKHQEAE